MNPQLIQALLSGQLTKDGAGPGGAGALGQMLSGSLSSMSGGSSGLVPMLLVLAGMGMTNLPKLFNSIMDMQSVNQDDASPDQQAGALAAPQDQGMPAPPQGMLPPGASAGAIGVSTGGPPPGMVPALLQLALQRRMAGGGLPMAA